MIFGAMPCGYCALRWNRILGYDNAHAVKRVIKEIKAESISALAEATGRKPGNLSRTLKTMANYGIVEMRREKRHMRPIPKATEFRIVAE